MRFYSGRLKRLEGAVGVAEKKINLIRIGFRTFDNCLATGHPFFRGPNGRCHNIAVVHEYCGQRFQAALDMSKESTKAVLKDLGYEEIKSRDEMQSRSVSSD